MNTNQNILINTINQPLQKNLNDKKWELLVGVKKGLEEIYRETNNSDIINLIEESDKLKEIHNKVIKQSDEMKLSLLVSSRERNVYLEKLRKIEEYCEDRNWEDTDGLLKEIKKKLYDK